MTEKWGYDTLCIVTARDVCVQKCAKCNVLLNSGRWLVVLTDEQDGRCFTVAAEPDEVECQCGIERTDTVKWFNNEDVAYDQLEEIDACAGDPTIELGLSLVEIQYRAGQLQ